MKKLEKLIFLFRRTNEAAVKNRKILAALDGDLGASNTAQKYSPLNHGSEFCDTAALTKLFHYQEDKNNIIKIIQKGSLYHIDPIKEETRK